ncbi:MAG: Proteasome subunit beta type-3 [Marteilia pararefringens]
MSDPSEYYGGTAAAVKGNECFAIASDLRHGESYTTLNHHTSKSFLLTPHLAVCLVGFRPDIQKLIADMKNEIRIYELREHRRISGEIFASRLSTYLYSFRTKGGLIVSAIVASFDPNQKQVKIFSSDSIGAMEEEEKCSSIGFASENLGTALTSLWKPNMSKIELEQAAAQAINGAIETVAFSGGKIEVIVVSEFEITKKVINCRAD